MKIQVIGASGSELPGHNLPAFLVDDFMLMDAGTIGLALDKKAQEKISHILITHAHLDHVKGIAFLVDNMVTNHFKNQITVISGSDVLSDVRRNIFNNRIWPDFTAIPDEKKPVMKYQAIQTRNYMQIKNYRIYAARVNHTVAAYGYIVEDVNGNAVVYTGDTGPTKMLWKRMNHHNVKALIIEISFPDLMNELALKSGHLTPSLLEGEIRKMERIPESIYITHVKPQYRKAIEIGLKVIKGPSVEILCDNAVISI